MDTILFYRGTPPDNTKRADLIREGYGRDCGGMGKFKEEKGAIGISPLCPVEEPRMIKLIGYGS